MNLSLSGDETVIDSRDVDTEVERSQRSHDRGSKGDAGLVAQRPGDEGTCIDHQNTFNF